MQVIPRFHMDKIGENADEDALLFDPRTNIRVGAMVLKEGLAHRLAAGCAPVLRRGQQ